MPVTSALGAMYDPVRSIKRDLIVLVTGFGDVASHIDNPASAIATKIDGHRHSVTNDWGNTVHLEIVGAANVASSFLEMSGGGTSAIHATEVSHFAKELHDASGAGAKNASAPQFVAQQIELLRPDVVIALGVDRHDEKIRIEREAHALARQDQPLRFPNAKLTSLRNKGEFVDPARPEPEAKIEAYLHDGDAFQMLDPRLPVGRIVDAINRLGIPCHDQRHTGSVATQGVIRDVLDEIDHPRNGVHVLRGGFIYLPPATHNIPVDRMLSCIIEACIETAKVIPEADWD